jgi:LPXTG-motif cell wall-anchored protein
MRRWQTSIVALGWAVMAVLGDVSLAGAQTQSLTLTLATQNNSGITGTATLTDLGAGKTRVEIKVNDTSAVPHPSHIHEGSCAQLNPTPQFSLGNVTGGTSTTEVDASLQQLLSSPHAVHLHKSPDELTVYVACADIQAASASAALPRTGDLGSSWIGLALVLAGLGISGTGYVLRRRRRPS